MAGRTIYGRWPSCSGRHFLGAPASRWTGPRRSWRPRRWAAAGLQAPPRGAWPGAEESSPRPWPHCSGSSPRMDRDRSGSARLCPLIETGRLSGGPGRMNPSPPSPWPRRARSVSRRLGTVLRIWAAPSLPPARAGRLLRGCAAHSVCGDQLSRRRYRVRLPGTERSLAEGVPLIIPYERRFRSPRDLPVQIMMGMCRYIRRRPLFRRIPRNMVAPHRKAGDEP